MSDESRGVDSLRAGTPCQSGPARSAPVSHGCDQALWRRPRAEWLTAPMKGDSWVFVDVSNGGLARGRRPFAPLSSCPIADRHGPFVDPFSSRLAETWAKDRSAGSEAIVQGVEGQDFISVLEYVRGW